MQTISPIWAIDSSRFPSHQQRIPTMREGFTGFHPNERVATALVLEGNLGIRISDILSLRPCDIVRDGDRYRLEIVEKKTGKH